MLGIGVLLLMAACGALFVALDVVSFQPMVRGLKGGLTSRRSTPSSARLTVGTDVDSLGRLRPLTTATLITKAQRNLALAGHRPGWTLRRMMLLKVWLAASVALFTLLLAGSSLSGQALVMVVLAVGFAFFVPDLLLDGRAKARQEQIQLELPDLLDQTLIAIESGMSFEAALSRVGETGHGPLAEEMVRTLQDMRLGLSRRAAYNALAERTSIEDLKRFCKQVIQAEEFGVSTSTLVRNLAGEMRLKRKYRAEEAAQKLPVKLIFPLVTCFLPVVFVVSLYPAVRALADFFST